MINNDRVVGGINKSSSIEAFNFYKTFCRGNIEITDSKTAEMVKYFTNTFLATKVSFANEMKMICDELRIDYDKVVEYSICDKRLGKSHWAVPGPDGKLGFGGSCFPKDLNAMISLCYQLGMWPHTLIGVWDTNLDVRPEKDWENLKGRAVTEG